MNHSVRAAASDAESARCLEEARASFEAAAEGSPVLERSYSIAGRTILVRFVGDDLVSRLGPALQHHPEGDPEAPTLTIMAWDAALTDAPLPRLPSSQLGGDADWMTRIAPVGRFRVRYDPLVRALNILERERAIAWFCVADAAEIPFWEASEPFRTILHWWMGEHGRQFVHSSAVGVPRGAVLIAGASGSGKSTTALACLAHADRLSYLGDDHCIVGFDPDPTVFNLYGTAKLDAVQACQLPELARSVPTPHNHADEKMLFHVGQYAPDRVLHRAPLRAVAVARVEGGNETTLEPLAPARALAAVAPNTILQLPDAGTRALKALGHIFRRVPTYTLRLGTDLPGIPAILERLMAG